MTNPEIIFAEAVNKGLYTEEQALEIIQREGSLPLHTFAGWKSRGKQVRKGEHARIQTRLWKLKSGKKAEAEDEADRFYLCKAFLFTAEQVETIEQ